MGCSMVADQVAHPAHLNARDTTLVFASRAPQVEIQGLKERMGWEHIPWYTITDDFDADFDVDQWHATNAFYREDDVNGVSVAARTRSSSDSRHSPARCSAPCAPNASPAS